MKKWDIFPQSLNLGCLFDFDQEKCGRLTFWDSKLKSQKTSSFYSLLLKVRLHVRNQSYVERPHGEELSPQLSVSTDREPSERAMMVSPAQSSPQTTSVSVSEHHVGQMSHPTELSAHRTTSCNILMTVLSDWSLKYFVMEQVTTKLFALEDRTAGPMTSKPVLFQMKTLP